MPDEIQLVKVNNPFHKEDKTISLMPYNGETLWKLRESQFPKEIDITVVVNDKVIPEDLLKSTVVKQGDSIIMIPSIRGGVGGKQVASIVAMIALAIAGPYVGAGLASGSWGAYGATIAAGGLMGSVFGAGIMVLGGYLVNQYIMPKQSIDTMDTTDMKTSQAWSWNSRTVQQEGLVKPIFYGINKPRGNVISTHIESIGKNQYLNVLLSLGVGPCNRLYDFKINKQPWTNYSGIEVHTRYGRIRQPAIPNFNTTKTEYTMSRLVAYGSPVVYTTTGTGFDQLEIDIYGAFFYVNALGNIDAHSVQVSVEIKKHADPDYTLITYESATTTLVTYGRWSRGFWNTVWCTDTPYTDWLEEEAGTSDVDEHYEGEDGGTSTTYYCPTYWHWIPGGAQERTVDTVNNYITITGNETSGITTTIKTDYNLEHAQYDIRVTKVSADVVSAKHGDDVYLTAVREVIRADFRKPREILAGIRALATNQLSGSFDFSCMMEGRLVRVYDGSIWSVAFSRNNAWVCYDILTRPVLLDQWWANEPYEVGSYVAPTVLDTRKYKCTTAGTSGATEPVWDTTPGNTTNDGTAVWTCVANTVADGVHRFDGTDPTNGTVKLNLADFLAWATFCDELVNLPDGTTEKRHLWDGGFDSEMSVWECAQEVAQSGEASLYWNGTEVRIIIDRATTPVQLFTMGNIVQGSFKETFLPLSERASRIEFDFISETKDYEKTKCTIINNNITTSRKITMNLPGVTRESEACRHGMAKLKKNELGMRTIEFGADVDAIACTLGDVINFQHDVPQWGYGGAVVSATTDTVTLDRTVTIAGGTTYNIMVMLSTGHEVVGTDGNYYMCKAAHTSVAGNCPITGGTYATYWELSCEPWVTATDYEVDNTVIGTDGKKYRCISPHTSAAGNKPITGAEYSLHWELDSAGLVWAPGTAYVPPDTVMTRTVTDGAGDYTTVTVSSNWDLIPSARDIYSFGAINAVVKPYRIIGLRKAQEQTFTITGFEYTADYYTNLDGNYTTIPAVSPTALDPFPAITGLEFHERLYISSTGDLKVEIEAGFKKPSSLWGYCKVYSRDLTNSGPWNYLGEARMSPFVKGDFNLSTEYELAFVTVNAAGVEDSFRNAVTDTITISSGPSLIDDPANVGTISTLPFEDGVTFSWARINSNWIRGYKVRTKVESGAWSSWSEIKDNSYPYTLTAAEKADQGKGNSTVYIEVTAIDIFDQESAAATAANDDCLNQKGYVTVGPTADGGNYTTIADALTAINTAGGGSIVIKNGTYQASDVLTVPNVDIEIICESRSTILKNKAGSNLFLIDDYTKTFSFTGGSIQSQNTSTWSYMFSVTGGSAGSLPKQIALDNVEFILKDDGTLSDSKGDRGLSFTPDAIEAGEVVVTGCRFVDGEMGVYGYDATRFVANNNVFEDQKYQGLLWFASSYEDATSFEMVVTDNKYSGSADGFSIGVSDILTPPEISNNAIIHGTVMGNLVRITGSSVITGGLEGIWVYGSQFDVSENTVTMTYTDASSGAVGIMAQTTGKVFNNTVIMDVTDSSSVTGIVLAYDGITCEGNQITIDNDDTTANHYGISVETSDRCVISNNNIDLVNNDAKDIGISLTSGSDNCQGSDNITYNCGTSISDAGTGNSVTAKDV